MKRIAYCCTLLLLILVLLVGCDEAKQKTSADAVVITHGTTTPEMTAAPTPRNYDAVIPTPTPRIFDVDDVNMLSTLESSCFSEIGYDSDWEILIVRFRDSGSVYTYSDFPEDEWNQFIAADSLGSWYNSHIKGQYEDKKIDG